MSRLDPGAELAAIRSMRSPLIKAARVLTLYCETGGCQVGRVFRRRDGLVVEIAGQGKVSVDQETIRFKHASFWLDEELSEDPDLPIVYSCGCRPRERTGGLTARFIDEAINRHARSAGV